MKSVKKTIITILVIILISAISIIAGSYNLFEALMITIGILCIITGILILFGPTSIRTFMKFDSESADQSKIILISSLNLIFFGISLVTLFGLVLLKYKLLGKILFGVIMALNILIIYLLTNRNIED